MNVFLERLSRILRAVALSACILLMLACDDTTLFNTEPSADQESSLDAEPNPDNGVEGNPNEGTEDNSSDDSKDDSSDDSKDDSSDDSKDDSSDDSKDDSGDDSKDDSSDDSKGDSGDDSKDDSSDDSKDDSSDDSKDDLSDDSKDDLSDDSKGDLGDDSKDDSGDDSKDDSGDDSKDDSGDDSKDDSSDGSNDNNTVVIKLADTICGRGAQLPSEHPNQGDAVALSIKYDCKLVGIDSLGDIVEDQDNAIFYIVDDTSHYLHKFNLISGKHSYLPIEVNTIDLSPSGDYLFASLQNTTEIRVYRTHDMNQVGVIKALDYISDLAATSDGIVYGSHVSLDQIVIYELNKDDRPYRYEAGRASKLVYISKVGDANAATGVFSMSEEDLAKGILYRTHYTSGEKVAKTSARKVLKTRLENSTSQGMQIFNDLSDLFGINVFGRWLVTSQGHVVHSSGQHIEEVFKYKNEPVNFNVMAYYHEYLRQGNVFIGITSENQLLTYDPQGENPFAYLPEKVSDVEAILSTDYGVFLAREGSKEVVLSRLDLKQYDRAKPLPASASSLDNNGGIKLTNVSCGRHSELPNENSEQEGAVALSLSYDCVLPDIYSIGDAVEDQDRAIFYILDGISHYIHKYDLVTGDRMYLPVAASLIDVSPSGDYLFASLRNATQIAVYRTSDFEQVGLINTMDYISDLAVTSDNTVYGSHASLDRIAIYELNDSSDEPLFYSAGKGSQLMYIPNVRSSSANSGIFSMAYSDINLDVLFHIHAMSDGKGITLANGRPHVREVPIDDTFNKASDVFAVDLDGRYMVTSVGQVIHPGLGRRGLMETFKYQDNPVNFKTMAYYHKIVRSGDIFIGITSKDQLLAYDPWGKLHNTVPADAPFAYLPSPVTGVKSILSTNYGVFLARDHNARVSLSRLNLQQYERSELLPN